MKKTITLLGVDGCPTCARLDERVKEALESIPGEIRVEKVTDPEKIMELNAGGLPAVIVDGAVKAVRRVPEAEELRSWLR
jgi:coenzyme F420-reducing hydrogenase gamma subunit